jgi:hypothetical protein
VNDQRGAVERDDPFFAVRPARVEGDALERDVTDSA